MYIVLFPRQAETYKLCYAISTCCLWIKIQLYIIIAQSFQTLSSLLSLLTPNLFGLIRTPGPIVEATTQDLIYWPLAAAGFALTIAPSKASKFS